eukprot:GHVS01048533.1.p1 GENE.GHVS01048533.1~~GHVS01048533.1.p1  ORF type:complete len:170 (-),score=36.66 GHVS01048533.1:285-794(-)
MALSGGTVSLLVVLLRLIPCWGFLYGPSVPRRAVLLLTPSRTSHQCSSPPPPATMLRKKKMSSVSRAMPGQDLLINKRFMFSGASSDATVQDSVLQSLDRAEYQKRHLLQVRGPVIVISALAAVVVLFKFFSLLKYYFELQQQQLRDEEVRLYGDYESPDATLRRRPLD